MLLIKEIESHPLSIFQYDQGRCVFRGQITQSDSLLYETLKQWSRQIPISPPDMNSYVGGVVLATPNIKINFTKFRVVISIGATQDTSAGHYSWKLRENDEALRELIVTEIKRLREEEARSVP